MSVAVVVDDREPSRVVDAVRAHDDVERVEVRRLDAGDVVVGEVGIERKTLPDYVRTLVGRGDPDLYDQVRRLTEAYAHPYLLLEAEFPADADEGVPAAAVRGSAASVTARLGAPVVPCSDLDRLVDVAVRLGRKHVEDPSASRGRLPSGSVTGLDAPTAKRMYGCIDGVGPGTAERLYEAYPTVEGLLAASTEDLLAIDGIGPSRAEAIRSAFREER